METAIAKATPLQAQTEFLNQINKTLQEWSKEPPSQREIDSFAKYLQNQPKGFSPEKSEAISALQGQVFFAKTGSQYNESSKPLIEQTLKEINKPITPSAIAQPTQISTTPSSKDFYQHVDKTLENWSTKNPTADEIKSFGAYISNFRKQSTEITSSEQGHLKRLDALVCFASPEKDFPEQLSRMKEKRLEATWGNSKGGG